VRYLRSEYGKNVVTLCPRERCTDDVGLTIEETIEFEALDALPPFDDSGNIAWVFEGEPTTLAVKNVGSNFTSKRDFDSHPPACRAGTESKT